MLIDIIPVNAERILKLYVLASDLAGAWSMVADHQVADELVFFLLQLLERRKF